jgi:hypothetical protein
MRNGGHVRGEINGRVTQSAQKRHRERRQWGAGTQGQLETMTSI